jgi:hypothetical protein
VLILGKLLETIGSGLIALVAVQAFILEAFVGRHLVPKQIDRQEEAGTDDVQRMGIKTVGEHLEAVYSLRRRQFGFREALAVAIGTLLIAVGCGLYLAGLWDEHPPSWWPFASS